mmetsp:Transcript_16051/g.34773  ORF Transcript_16051/g.34773 Transcript_16051/m.34773 type:complete len:265 (-) Transcript_16051:335-1129(-)
MGRIFLRAGTQFQTNDSVLRTRSIFLPPGTVCGQSSLPMAVVRSANFVARGNGILHLLHLVGTICEVSPVHPIADTDTAPATRTRLAPNISLRTRSVRRQGCQFVVCPEYVPREYSQSNPNGFTTRFGPAIDDSSDVPGVLENFKRWFGRSCLVYKCETSLGLVVVGGYFVCPKFLLGKLSGSRKEYSTRASSRHLNLLGRPYFHGMVFLCLSLVPVSAFAVGSSPGSLLVCWIYLCFDFVVPSHEPNGIKDDIFRKLGIHPKA